MPKYFINKFGISYKGRADGGSYKSSIEISGDMAHHLVRVLRVRAGERIILCDGENTDYEAVIRSVQHQPALVSADILDKHPSETEPSVLVTLYQGIPKSGKLETIVQKCVEIGVYSVVPVFTERSEISPKNWNESKTKRLRAVAESAASQSMRGIIPEVYSPVSWNEALDLSRNEDMVLVAWENERERSVSDVLRGIEAPSRIGLWIGSEGGFSESSLADMRRLGFHSVTLGPRILRTETAGMASLVHIFCALEEYGKRGAQL